VIPISIVSFQDIEVAFWCFISYLNYSNSSSLVLGGSVYLFTFLVGGGSGTIPFFFANAEDPLENFDQGLGRVGSSSVLAKAT
jgi:hypothetical protein